MFKFTKEIPSYKKAQELYKDKASLKRWSISQYPACKTICENVVKTEHTYINFIRSTEGNHLIYKIFWCKRYDFIQLDDAFNKIFTKLFEGVNDIDYLFEGIEEENGREV
jgi:hypothetical protein